MANDHDTGEAIDAGTGRALDQLVQAAVHLAQVAESAMPDAERARLHDAIDTGRAQFSVTMILPSGAVRVGVAGQWDGEKTLWELTPIRPVLERTNLS